MAILKLNSFIIGFILMINIVNAQTEKNREKAKWELVKRTTKEISKVEESVMKFGKDTWKLDFYRNKAYKCGISGHYTFLVVEPRNKPGIKAPLWVFFHGGGAGYYDKDGKYRTVGWLNENSFNREASLNTLRKINPNHPIFDKGRLIDNTVTRRLKEGYRVLVVSYGDHDLYAGCGTPYPNNPRGGQVNGLQASMSAVEYTTAHYPTTHVFAQGTSAGSVGAYALGFAFAQEGINLTGVVMDSGIVTPRQPTMLAALAGKKGYPNSRDYSSTPGAIQKKIGVMAEHPFYPEAAVEAGYRSVPMLIIAGKKDEFFGGGLSPIPEAKAAGLCNHYWLVDGLCQAIKKQKDSPHQVLKLDEWGHVPTNKEGSPAHDVVDAFIKKVTAPKATHPFAKKPVSR